MDSGQRFVGYPHRLVTTEQEDWTPKGLYVGRRHSWMLNGSILVLDWKRIMVTVVVYVLASKLK